MALQLFKISDVLVESPVTTVTFNSIPSGYTDLKIVCSSRDNTAAAWGSIYLRFNGSTTSYSGIQIYGTGSAAASTSSSIWGTNYALAGRPAGNDATALTFGNSDIYIPNYTSSNNKSISGDGVGENNGTSSFAMLVASLWSNSSAITSIEVMTPGQLFQAGSTFTLYGIL